MLFLIGCLVIAPAYIPTGRQPLIFCVSIIASTLIAVGICTLAAKWRLWATEFICPMTVAFRAVAAYLTIKNSLYLECNPTTLDVARRFFNLTFFFTDLILFKTNIYTNALITTPLLVITGALNMKVETSLLIPICPAKVTD